MQELETIANELRKELIRKHSIAKMPHLGSDLSCLDIMVALYFKVMGKDDHFLLSKGHAAIGLYAVLHRKKIMGDELYDSIGKDGSRLGEHPTVGINGIEIATGSLGHGLPIASGMALANKNDGKKGRIYVLLSDGECEEGSTLEAMNFAGRVGLSNLTAIVDYNGWQAFDRTLFKRKSLAKMFDAAGWDVREVNGHNYKELVSALEHTADRPSLIIAKTVLGKGTKQLEDTLAAHYKYPTPEEAADLISGLQ
jgi:transketolase